MVKDLLFPDEIFVLYFISLKPKLVRTKEGMATYVIKKLLDRPACDVTVLFKAVVFCSFQ